MAPSQSVSDLLGPFTPRHQQSIVIADIELLSIISVLVRGIPWDGVVHILVTDNVNAMPWMNRKRAKRGISPKLLDPFILAYSYSTAGRNRLLTPLPYWHRICLDATHGRADRRMGISARIHMGRNT